MAFEADRGGSGLEPKLAGLRLTPADFAGPRRRTPQDLGRILAGPGTGPSGPPVLEGPMRRRHKKWSVRVSRPFSGSGPRHCRPLSGPPRRWRDDSRLQHFACWAPAILVQGQPKRSTRNGTQIKRQPALQKLVRAQNRCAQNRCAPASPNKKGCPRSTPTRRAAPPPGRPLPNPRPLKIISSGAWPPRRLDARCSWRSENKTIMTTRRTWNYSCTL